MGILEKIKRAFLRLDCQGCGKPLAEGQRDVCSDECELRAEEWHAHR
jgi:predicted nucleic acid-binding Zn ribbon protein